MNVKFIPRKRLQHRFEEILDGLYRGRLWVVKGKIIRRWDSGRKYHI